MRGYVGELPPGAMEGVYKRKNEREKQNEDLESRQDEFKEKWKRRLHKLIFGKDLTETRREKAAAAFEQEWNNLIEAASANGYPIENDEAGEAFDSAINEEE